MVTYYVKLNELYTVTATTTCDVLNESGSLIGTCEAGKSLTFKASTVKVKLTDNNADLRRRVTESSSGAISEECVEHMENKTIHLTDTQATKIANSAQLNGNANFNVCTTGRLDTTHLIATGEVSVNKLTKSNAGYELTETSVLNKSECDALYGNPFLVGEIKWYAGQTIPDGWLLCDGSAVSREEYEDLYYAIGRNWGDGDGSTTFNLPNLIDRVAWGTNEDGVGGYIDAGLPNITGSFVVKDANGNAAAIKNPTGAISTNEEIARTLGLYYNSGSFIASDTAKFDASKSNAIYGGSSTVQPPAAKLIPIIKY